MPEHVHLLISEPESGTPSAAIQILKQRVPECSALSQLKKRTSKSLITQLDSTPTTSSGRSASMTSTSLPKKKKIEKLNYMHMNPVKRGLVASPDEWIWSSYSAYQEKGKILIPIDRVEP